MKNLLALNRATLHLKILIGCPFELHLLLTFLSEALCVGIGLDSLSSIYIS
jgi:hypothetical protein